MFELFKKISNLKTNTQNNKTANSPLFIGSKKEFNKYFSGYGRNLVQSITKKHKKAIGKCEHCGTTEHQLDSAHVKGKERKDIINNIISKYESNGRIEINLNAYEQEFIEAHNPIQETIKILCKSCHRKYDNGSSVQIKVNVTSKTKNANYYKATRLAFKRDVIEPLKEDEKFSIYLTNTNETFTMSKSEFYDVFRNVTKSNSYKLNGIYSYSTTPKKTYQFLLKKSTHLKQEAKPNLILTKASQKEKIGKYVKERVKNLWAEGLIDQEETQRLQSPGYSKQTFNGTFEILRKSTRERKDDLGYSRYYKNEIIPGYWLSSQWYESQRDLFKSWENQLRKAQK